MNEIDLLREKLKLLPDKSGCYLMKDQNDSILYVGKAKSLKSRVRSYFTGSHNAKTQALVSHIRDFEYIVTDTVVEALILECNLIKQHSPYFNIQLKDDKAYPYIKITKEEHPRLEIVRRVLKDKAKYFGPYPNASAARDTKKLLDRLFPLRKCRTLKPKVCLYYHINQCVAPCEFPVEQETYQEMIKSITLFLNGGHQKIREELHQKMMQEAENLNFERAKEIRDQIRQIDLIMEKQKIELGDTFNRDVFGVHFDKGLMCVQVFYIRGGKMTERQATVFQYHADPDEDFASYVAQFYYENPDIPKEILLPVASETDTFAEWLHTSVKIPMRGPKKKLVEMACENARIALEERFKLMERDMDRTVRAVQELGELLAIPVPNRIEAFDNSNIQGSDAVAAMVVFEDGQPSRKEYRKFKIKTVEGPDDYGSMREVIRRRYIRVLKDKLPLPDLIVIDGGKGQIAAALDVLINELNLEIPVCSLAKDERHRTSLLFYMEDTEPVPIRTNSQAFYLLTRIQDEVHRFAITFHRQVHGKEAFRSLLDEIPGVGEQRRKALLKHFGSVESIRNAQIDDFRRIGIGDKLAREILDFLKVT